MTYTIATCIWCDVDARELATYYAGVFPDVDQQGGSVLSASWTVAGHPFQSLNGGPIFRPTPAVSFFYMAADAEALRGIWAALTDQGAILMPLDRYPFGELYGWVADRYGVSWQIMLDPTRTEPVVMPSLTFVGSRTGQAEAAARAYASIFATCDPSDTAPRIGMLDRYGDSLPGMMQPEWVSHGRVRLADRWHVVSDGGDFHDWTFSEGMSLVAQCPDQPALDRLWDALLATGGQEQQCGWLRDGYGVSWQVVPADLAQILSADSSAMGRLLSMVRIDIDQLQRRTARP